MQVILLERIEKLGQMGDVVAVKDGFARNYLVPRGKALRATKAALDDFEKGRGQLEARNLEQKQEAQGLAAKVDGQSVVILRQASETSQLYGSVNARDIAEAFAEDGVTFDRRQVRLDAPLKALGIHQVRVALHPEVDVQVAVNIARSREEAEMQSDPDLAAARAAEQQAEQDTGGTAGASGEGESDALKAAKQAKEEEEEAKEKVKQLAAREELAGMGLEFEEPAGPA
jgi:large subunit ribosomal protein L9